MAKNTKSTRKTSKKTIKKTKKIHITPIIIVIALVIGIGFGIYAIVRSISNSNSILVETNAFFAPFEYYSGKDIVGVDIDIMDRVGQRLNKKIKFTNVEFSAIIDNVADGKVCDAGAAGLTITEERAAKVNFSIPYYTSSQYVIYKAGRNIPRNGKGHITWASLANSIIGVQTDSTSWIFADDAMSNGELKGTQTTLKAFDFSQLAADGIVSNFVDFAIVDEIPAKYIVSKNHDLALEPLYSPSPEDNTDIKVEEQYAIAVNKDQTELLNTINDILEEMLIKDETGLNEIEHLVLKHMEL